MENREFWNPLHFLWIDSRQETGPGPWKEVEIEECQKIASMPIGQLFEYIDHVLADPIEQFETQYVCYLNSSEIFGLSGPEAADEFGGTIACILKALERRLESRLLHFTRLRVGSIRLKIHVSKLL